jgi:hypothetical protein
MERERSSFYNSFNTEFEKQLPLNENYRSAFHAADQKFQDAVGQSPYKTWESFKVARSKRRKK